jgi:hypothetical protein
MIASCTKVGKEQKIIGNKLEKNLYKIIQSIKINADTEYGATSETTINKTHANYAKCI